MEGSESTISAQTHGASADEEVPVLIVGGGGSGLTASMLLSEMGVDSLLVSAFPKTSNLPKAHVLHQRAMEIMREVGVAEEIHDRGTPLEQLRATAWYAGLAGSDEDCGRRLGRAETWGNGYTDPSYVAASPCATENLPQIRLEPILKARAEVLAPNRVRFNHEVVALEQNEDGVVAVVRDKDRDTEYRVRCAYVLACDGGRTIAEKVGVTYEGLGTLTTEASIHMSADLSPWARDPDVSLRWIWPAHTGKMVVTAPMGPDRWGPDSEEWVVHINYAPDDERVQSDELVEADMRDALGLGDTEVEVHRITRWVVEGVLADRFRVGRVFMVGDAAHRHPPTGGLGLTSGMQDAHNICWKLALVLAGRASDELLESYEPERRPVTGQNVQRALENAVNQLSVGPALGLDPEATEEENWAQLKRVWSGRPEDAEHRAGALAAIRRAETEFKEHAVEYGYTYSSSAVVDDGAPQPAPVDDVVVYEQSTRPGHPLPHAWLEDEDGRRQALMDLVGSGRFLIIAGEDGQVWCEAAKRIAEENDLPLDALRIGRLDGDLFDACRMWMRHREITSEGAVLVRPDRVIGWRCADSVPEPEVDLARALGQILGCHIEAGRPVAA